MTGRSPATDTDTTPTRGRFRSGLRDAKIRSKLGLILVIPLVAVIILAGLRLVDSGQRALEANLLRSLAEVSAEAAEVAHQVHAERMAAAWLLGGYREDSSEYNAQSGRTDQAIDAYERARAALGDVPEAVASRLDRVNQQLETLTTIRQEILGDSNVTSSAAMLRYGVIIDDLLAYQEAVGQVAGDAAVSESVQAVASLSRAKLQMSDGQAEAFLILHEGITDGEQVLVFLATQTGVQESLLAFSRVSTPAQQDIVNSTLAGGAVVLAEQAVNEIMRTAGEGTATIDVLTATRALGATVNLMRIAEQQLHANQVDLATSLNEAVTRQVLIESAVVLLVLLIAIAIAVLLARMLARSLTQLRESALTVAERDLPETVARLSDPRTLGENTPEQLAAEVQEPIQLRSRDEVGQVAQAFNVVHRAAVRVAAEQAALRTSVSAMFLNLARRSQSLVDRMISQLDEIERNEEDPKRLARMFVLDNLATRMRRNDENLLVLAGADSSPPRTEDALVADVLRAAQSEVEHYARIEFGTVDSDVSVISHAVNDVVRLVAELFDNATRFSPPESAVVCEARRLGDQVIVQIEDRGVGMPQEQVERLNAFLAAPPALEVTTFRKMGLAVVARLANRHQIRVELRCDPNYGTVAYVALPRGVLILPRSRMRSLEAAPPQSPLPVAQLPAAPPLPSRHVGGQLPRRSPGATQQHTAGRGWRDEPTQQQPTAASHSSGLPTRQPEVNHFDLPVAGRPLYELTSHQDTSGQPTASRETAGSAATETPDRSGMSAPTVASPMLGGRSGQEGRSGQDLSAPASTNAPEATVELPIFHQMEQSWFRTHGRLDLNRGDESAASTAGAGSGGSRTGGMDSASTMNTPRIPTQSTYQDEPETVSWQTAADHGWRAAAAAAKPSSGGATASGLPKRVPQAQLVPGSVETPSASSGPARRSPEEIRGLLSAYHRGVQRGRETGAH